MTKKPDKPSDFDLDTPPLFDDQSSSRLVWVLPSILLHLIVFAVWFFMPEKEPREVQRREMSINSRQAEQLQQFVEDTNLKELHVEVRRLQEIKQSMAGIRTESLNTLEVFEAEMRNSIDADAGQVLADIQICQNDFLHSQQQVLRRMTDVNKRFDTVMPLIQRKDIDALVPLFEELAELRNSLGSDFEEMTREVIRLKATMDSADAVLSWQDDPDAVLEWEAFVKFQEDVFAKQSGCSDQQGRLQVQQRDALARITGNRVQLQSLADRTKTALDEIEKKKKEGLADLKRIDLEEKKVTARSEAIEEAIQDIQDELKALDQKRTNSRDQRQKKEILDEIVALRPQVNILKKERNQTVASLRQLKQKRTLANRKLGKKKPVIINEKNKQMLMGRIESNLNDLNGRAGDVAAQQDVMKLQQDAARLSQALMKMIRDAGDVQ